MCQIAERVLSTKIVFRGADNRLDGGAAVVDTGYCTHAAQTVALIGAALQGQPLERIFNTHLHSDHCGGNAALQAAWPGVRTAVPPGHLAQVQGWDAYALSYTPTGQQCPRFGADAALLPGTEVRLGVRLWQVHAAPGHDPHSIVLFEPQDALLISADALWENGFGVVFPELEGEAAFAEVAATLDLIERLAPRTVIPGHGPVFYDAPRAIDTARRRLDGFVREPLKHALHGAKVLLKYKLLEWQQIALVDVRSPVNQAGITFFEILFDENATCHIAFGEAYPEGMVGSAEMDETTLAVHGVNDADTHVDFMIGSPQMDIDGITKDGQREPVMRQGEWAISL